MFEGDLHTRRCNVANQVVTKFYLSSAIFTWQKPDQRHSAAKKAGGGEALGTSSAKVGISFCDLLARVTE